MFQALHPLFLHDGTERPINRPSDPDEQEWYYSGKKRQHTIKNIVVIDDTVRVWCLGATWEGTCHDKRAADSEPYQLPPGSTLYQDMGFQGFEVAGVVVIQPTKKPRGSNLTAAEKEENRRINSIRVRIEHAISGIKRCRIVKDKLRLWREHFHDMVMETCCGLHNYRLRYRPWTYPFSNESG